MQSKNFNEQMELMALQDSPEMIQLTEMLRYQDYLNSVIAGGDWRSDPKIIPYRAVYLEAAEGIEHIGWKWWKKIVSDLPQAFIEAVDILHFMLVEAIKLDGGKPTEGNETAYYRNIASKMFFDDALEIIEGDNYTIINLDIPELDQRIVVDPQNTVELFELLMFFTLYNKFAALNSYSVHMTLFMLLIRSMDMEFKDVFEMYVAKNALNIFRQQNGYKEGHYEKIWQGNEDNVEMEAIFRDYKELNGIHANSLGDILNLLKVRYHELTGK